MADDDRDELASDEVDIAVVEERVRSVSEDAPFVSGGPGIADFLSPGPGIVIDPAVAREAPCVGYELAGIAGEPDVVFVKGIAGPLDASQVEAYCDTVHVRDLTPEQMQRVEDFRQSAAVCHTEEGDALEEYLGCMGRELHARGQKL